MLDVIVTILGDIFNPVNESNVLIEWGDWNRIWKTKKEHDTLSNIINRGHFPYPTTQASGNFFIHPDGNWGTEETLNILKYRERFLAGVPQNVLGTPTTSYSRYSVFNIFQSSFC